MKLVIEFDLDGDLDITANFHALARSFFRELGDLVPNEATSAFSGFYKTQKARGELGKHGEIAMMEVKLGLQDSPVVARAMLLPDKMSTEALNRPHMCKTQMEEIEMAAPAR